MITPGPFVAAAHRRLMHRSYHEADGSVRMVRGNGKHAVWLTEVQWQDLLNDFTHARQPINRALIWGFSLALPMFIISVILYNLSGLLHPLNRLGWPILNISLTLLLMFWWPIMVTIRYVMAARKIDAMVENRLAAMPVASMPPARPILFQTLEIVALFLVGPGLIINVIGNLFPHLFDHTPLMGSGIDLFSGAGILLFAFFAGRRLSRHLHIRL